MLCNELMNYAVRIVIHPVVRGCSIKGLGIACFETPYNWGSEELMISKNISCNLNQFFYLP